MSGRGAPWYQAEPYPSVVRVLMARQLLAEGGTRSLRLAARVAAAERDRAEPVEAVAGQLLDEDLTDDWTTALDAAEEIVRVLADWPDRDDRRA